MPPRSRGNLTFDHLAEAGVGDVPIPPGDVAADHAALFAVAGVVGAVQGEGRASNVGFSLPRSVCPEEIDQEDAQAGDEAEGSAHDAHHEQGMSLQQANEPVGGLGGCVRRHVGAPVPIALRSACRAPMGGDGWTVIARDALRAPDTTPRGGAWPPAGAPRPPHPPPPRGPLPPALADLLQYEDGQLHDGTWCPWVGPL